MKIPASLMCCALLAACGAKAPEGSFVQSETGVVVTPGRGYGEQGEGFFRISLTVPDDRLVEALARIKTAFS